MDLIKENIQKRRKVYKLDDCYRKEWDWANLSWLRDHVELLEKINPGHLKDWGYTDSSMWLETNIVEGVPANTFKHTPQFVDKIYNFCLHNIEETKPYAHGDWVLSNMIINQDKITLVDWDNLGIYPKEEIIQKMHNDLKSAFGNMYDKF